MRRFSENFKCYFVPKGTYFPILDIKRVFLKNQNHNFYLHLNMCYKVNFRKMQWTGFKNAEFGHKNFPQNKSSIILECLLMQKKNQKISNENTLMKRRNRQLDDWMDSDGFIGFSTTTRAGGPIISGNSPPVLFSHRKLGPPNKNLRKVVGFSIGPVSRGTFKREGGFFLRERVDQESTLHLGLWYQR